MFNQLVFYQKQGRIYQGLAETLLVDMGFSELSTYGAMKLTVKVKLMTEAATTPQNKDQPPIKASELDPKFKYELQKIHGSEKILKCFQCGTCTSDCPVARYSDSYRPRTLIHMAQLGLKRPSFKQRHPMALRGMLHMHRPLPTRRRSCKRHPRIPQLSRRKRLCPTSLQRPSPSLLESGYAYKIPELRIKKRESQGLPPLPKGNPEKVRKALKGVKFIETIQKPAGEKPSGQ